MRSLYAFAVVVSWLINIVVYGNLIDTSRLPLSAPHDQQFIVDKYGVPVRLACVNWYGAQLQQYVVDGLYERTLANISGTIRELGFNCVRLVFSLELYVHNPIVANFSLTKNPQLMGMTGMEIFDAVIQQLGADGILVILNNHNSIAGWCCYLSDINGIWDVPGYPATLWVSVLANMTARYANYSYVIGFDIRNEIHDVGWREITYGTTKDLSTDWKVASQTAGASILEKNADMLVIVGGLCFDYDLRPLQASPPYLPVDDRLVFTAHSYSYSEWWNLIANITGITWEQIHSACIVLITLSVGIPIVTMMSSSKFRWSLSLLSRINTLITLSGWALGLSLLFVASGFAWYYAMIQAGCRFMGSTAVSMMIASGVLAGFSLICVILTCLSRRRVKVSNEDFAKIHDDFAFRESEHGRCAKCCISCCPLSCCLLNVFVTCLVVFAFAVPLLVLATAVNDNQILAYDVSIKWKLQSTTIPIWIGEFGGNDPTDPWWFSIIDLFGQYNTSWSYWALNGNYIVNSTDFVDETYGVLEQDWLSLRHPSMLANMQTVMN